jgi:ribosome-binding factor A
MAYRRADRVNALLQRELATLISEELRDPRIAFPTVTGVETTADLKTAKVFVSVLGDDEAVESTMRALREARPFIRREVGERTDLRFVPDIEFVSDTSAARAARNAKLLREANGDR